MKKYRLLLMLLIIITSSVLAQTQTLSSSFFIQQVKKTEAYRCIQIRRGDIITLSGKIEIVDSKTESNKENLFFTSQGGRTFFIKGELIQEIIIFYKTLLESKTITLTGKVVFEGWEQIPAVMEVSAFKPQEKTN